MSFDLSESKEVMPVISKHVTRKVYPNSASINTPIL